MDYEALKKRKKELRYSYDKIAEISGIPKTTVTNVMTGRTKHPRIDTMQAIEKALGLRDQQEWSEEEIALGVGNTPINVSMDEYHWLELRSELLRLMGEEYLKTLEAMLQLNIDKAKSDSNKE